MGVTRSLTNSVTKRIAPEAVHVAPNFTAGFVHKTVHRAVDGAGPLPGAAEVAAKHLAAERGVIDRAIHEVIKTHTILSGAQGFVTNIGGLVVMPATIPLNIAGLSLLQFRMVAAIAHLRGYDLQDPRVHNAVLITTLGEPTVKALVREHKLPGPPMLVATSPAHDPALDVVVAGEVGSALISRAVGKHAAGQVVRKVPLAGSFWGGTADAYATWQVGKYAADELRPRFAVSAPVKSAWSQRLRRAR